MLTGGQDLHFRHPVQQVVVRLAGHRARHAQAVAQAGDLGNAPATEVRHGPVADLAGADQVAHGAHRLLEVGAGEVAVQVEDVHIVGSQPAQAVFHLAQDPRARIVRLVRTAAHRVAELGGEHPVVAVGNQQAAHHLLGAALAVDIGGVDEIDAVVTGAGHDAGGLGLVGLVREHHGAQAQGGNVQVAGAEAAVLHGEIWHGEFPG
ncbi:hypothetical protein D3C81_884910 [compost metagenome]